MNKRPISCLLLVSAILLPASAGATTGWELIKGELYFQQRSVNWENTSSAPCHNCDIRSSSEYTSGPLKARHIYQGNELKAIKVDDSCDTVSIPTRQGRRDYALSYNRDGSLMLHSNSGPAQHIKRHQANRIVVDGQSYSFWLDGYNPASRNRQYDDAHDAPRLSYTLVLN